MGPHDISKPINTLTWIYFPMYITFIMFITFISMNTIVVERKCA